MDVVGEEEEEREEGEEGTATTDVSVVSGDITVELVFGAGVSSFVVSELETIIDVSDNVVLLERSIGRMIEVSEGEEMVRSIKEWGVVGLLEGMSIVETSAIMETSGEVTVGS